MNFIFLSCMPATFLQRALGAYQIAHHLRTFGYTCQVIEFTQFFSNEELIETVEKFLTKDTLGIGVSTTWYDSREERGPIRFFVQFSPSLPDNIVGVLEYVKSNYPTVKRIAGGTFTKVYKNSPLFDHHIHSYAEDQMLKYANSISGKTKFDTFNIETLEHRFTEQDCILPGEMLPIEISRGCIFKCSFCNFPLNGKKKMDYIRSAKLIAEEMQYNYDKYGTTTYLFTDDTFNDTTIKLQLLWDEVKKLPFKIKFFAFLRIDLLNAHREQIKLLKDLGLKVAAFGIETFHTQAAKSIGKGMSGDRTKVFLDELYNDHWGDCVRIHALMMTGLPGEPLEHSRESMQWLHSRPFSSLFSTFSLYEHYEDKSKISSEPNKYGYKIQENGKWQSNLMKQEESERFYIKHFPTMVKNDVLYDGFHLIAAFNHYDHDKVMKITWKDVVNNYDSIYNEKLTMFNQYKARLHDIADSYK